LQVAAQHVRPEYDYVFIDEAQDLKPVAIQFCIGLCKKPRNVFLTADTNQSIWGNGMSWTKVSSQLNFKGRARILRRNYRTTTEIWEAIKQLAPDTVDTDRETMDVETVFHGPWPVLARYSDSEQQGTRLNAFLHEALRMERVTLNCAAVLCPTQSAMDRVVEMIDSRFNAKAMKSSEVNFTHPGVKVLTMHAAKGLQFPVVAVVGVPAERTPLAGTEGNYELEYNARQQRLLFVACSRAIRRLILFESRDRPSPFLKRLTDERWQIEDL
jgi:superfamily I DNA/RNA helicase